MESVNQIIKSVLDSFFDLSEEDKAQYLSHISTEDTGLIADAVEQALKNKGVI